MYFSIICTYYRPKQSQSNIEEHIKKFNINISKQSVYLQKIKHKISKNMQNTTNFLFPIISHNKYKEFYHYNKYFAKL
jgi:hypothetical protein